MVRVGIIGTGLIAMSHAASILQCGADCKITALCNHTQEKMDRFADMFNLKDVRKYLDYKEMIDAGELDAVSVCTSNDCHREIVIYAAEHGINVLCEKPLGMNADEVREMAEACEKAGIINMTGFTYRRIPAIAKIKKLIDDGALGHIYHYRGRFYADRLAPLDHEIEWRHLEERAGSGVIGDLASHTLDMALYLLSSQCSKVVDLLADGRVIVPYRKDKATGEMKAVTTEETCTVIGHFDSGCEMVLENSRYSPFDVEIHISGEKGDIKYNLAKYDQFELKLSESPADYFKNYKTVTVEPEKAGFKILPTDRMQRQYLYMCDCIEKGTQAHPTIKETIYIQELLDSMKESYKEEKKIRFN